MPSGPEATVARRSTAVGAVANDQRLMAAASDAVLASDADTECLAKMGYKQELKRNFSTLETFGIAFSIMGLLPSIASTLSFSLPAGGGGMVWSWFLASVCIFLVGLALAELSSSMPTSGGPYWWTHHFSSPATRNYLCYLAGYSNNLGLIAGLCGVDYGFALMFLSVFVIANDGNWEPSRGLAYVVFMVCVLSHGILASAFSKVIGKMQTVSVFMNIALISATIIALPVGAAQKRNDGGFIFSSIQNLTAWPTGWGFMLAWLSPIWTIASLDSCAHMAEESLNAATAVPLGILSSICMGGILGFVTVIVIAATVDPNLSNVLGSSFGQPMAQIYYDSLGKKGAIGFMCLVFIVQYQMGLSLTVAASRQLWAFSRDGALPFSPFFRQISKTFGYVPLRAIWGAVLLALVLGLLCLIASAAANAVFSLAVAGNYLAWGLPILARAVWGREKFVPGAFYTGRFSLPIAWAAIIFIMFGIVLAMFPTEGPEPSLRTMNYTIVVVAAVWGGATLYYALFASHWFTGPRTTLQEAEPVIGEQVVDKMRLRDGVVIPGSDKMEKKDEAAQKV